MVPQIRGFTRERNRHNRLKVLLHGGIHGPNEEFDRYETFRRSEKKCLLPNGTTSCQLTCYPRKAAYQLTNITMAGGQPMVSTNRCPLLPSCAFCAWLGTIVPAASADLGPQPRLAEPMPSPSQWQFSFTPYAWLPWISGDVVVKGRTLDVAVDPAQIIDALDWPDIVPVWMSHAEARRGPLSLFNDVVWADLAGSEGFSRTFHRSLAPTAEKLTATFGGKIGADYHLLIVEAGGAYSIWSRGSQGSPGSTAFDLLAGARYWHQELDVSADLTATLALSGPLDLTVSRNRAIAKSGSVDWVDPFIGARLRKQFAA